MSLLIVLASVAAYIAIGVLYGRTCLPYCHRKAAKQWRLDDLVRESTNQMVAWRVLFWPWGMAWDAANGPVREWFWAPQRAHEERIQTLREDAQRWNGIAWDLSETEEKRQMARELSDLCNERVKDLDR